MGGGDVTEQEIIALQKRAMQEKFGSIHSKVTIVNGKRYHFVEQEIPVAGMLMRLPREFIDLPPGIAKRKYPSEERPQCIKSSRDVSTNFAFKTIAAAAREEDLIPMRNGVLDALKRVHPQNTYMGTGVGGFGPGKGRIYCWFEYAGPTLDDETYSFNAILRQNGKPLYFVFNCPKNAHEGWRPIVFEAIDTIRDKPIGWKGEAER
jgi:hypothetical protein